MKKYIVFALIALFAAVLFIACDNDVKVDNSVAFTQRIASEGAFVVNGKSYDSLQAAINAATGAKMPAPDPVKITLTKDYAGRAVSIPKDAQVAIDLNGHTLTFVDLKETTPALSVEEGAYFALRNGTVTILDKTEGLTLIDADDAHVFFSDVYADLSDDQNAVIITGSANGKAGFAASADSIVFGAVTAIGEHAAGDLSEYSDVALIVLNALSDVRMTNTYIDVSSTGHVTLNALAGENRFRATKGSSSITNNTDEPIVIFGGLYSIKRTSSMSYYGSLQEALDSLDKDGLVIVLRDNDDSTNPVVASNGKSFTIELYGNYYGPGYGIHATSITADADMEIVNSGYSNSVIYSEIYGDIDVAGKFVVTGNYGRIHIDGTVTSDGVDASNTQFNKDINSSGAVEAEDCLFYEAPSITAGDYISINSSYGVIGDIVASGAINLSTPQVNNTAQLTVGAVNASSNNVSITGHIEDYVIVNGAVTAGEVTASYAEFGGDIFATTAAILNNSYVGYEECVDVFAPEIKISGSDLNVNYLRGTEAGAPATSVSVTTSTGTIGTIVASNSITLSTPEMTSPTDTYALEVGSLNAGTGDIAINNVNTNSYGGYVYVNGAVTAGEVTAYNAEFRDDIFATTAAKLTNSKVGNGAGDGVFAPEIEISGSTLNVNYLQGTEAGAPATSVSVTESTGTIGTIVASDSTAITPVITLSTPEMTSPTDTNTLGVGSLNADTGDIAINYVNTDFYDGDYVYVSGKVSCATLYANNASFNDSSRVEASELTGGHYYGTVTLSGSGIINIASGNYETVEYNGTGTLNTTLNEIVIDKLYNCDGAGTINVNGGTILDIDNIKANVNIKQGTIYEGKFSDVVELVHRINQDSDTQSVSIIYDRDEGIEFLTGGVFNMTSVNIEGYASLCFKMDAPEDASYVISRGLIVGSPNGLAASISFNFDNGYGKKQLTVSGIIGLLVEDGSGQSGDHNVILSTQQHGGLVTKCTYSGTTSYTYTLATGPGSTASPEPISYPGYYKYSF